MAHRQKRPPRVPGNARTTPRVLLILTTSCSSAHHEQCFHQAFDRGLVFQCACACHASKQIPLAF